MRGINPRVKTPVRVAAQIKMCFAPILCMRSSLFRDEVCGTSSRTATSSAACLRSSTASTKRTSPSTKLAVCARMTGNLQFAEHHQFMEVHKQVPKTQGMPRHNYSDSVATASGDGKRRLDIASGEGPKPILISSTHSATIMVWRLCSTKSGIPESRRC